jgi:hypothetical protein
MRIGVVNFLLHMLELDVIKISGMAHIKREGVWNPIHTFTVIMQMPVPSVLSFLFRGAAGFWVNVMGMWVNVLHVHRRIEETEVH